MNYGIDKLILFYEAARKAEEHGGLSFRCPLCGALAYVARVCGRLRARCGCGAEISE